MPARRCTLQRCITARIGMVPTDSPHHLLPPVGVARSASCGKIEKNSLQDRADWCEKPADFSVAGWLSGSPFVVVLRRAVALVPRRGCGEASLSGWRWPRARAGAAVPRAA